VGLGEGGRGVMVWLDTDVGRLICIFVGYLLDVNDVCGIYFG
jgi:hypothetical protein